MKYMLNFWDEYMYNKRSIQLDRRKFLLYLRSCDDYILESFKQDHYLNSMMSQDKKYLIKSNESR